MAVVLVLAHDVLHRSPPRVGIPVRLDRDISILLDPSAHAVALLLYVLLDLTYALAYLNLAALRHKSLIAFIYPVENGRLRVLGSQLARKLGVLVTLLYLIRAYDRELPPEVAVAVVRRRRNVIHVAQEKRHPRHKERPSPREPRRELRTRHEKLEVSSGHVLVAHVVTDVRKLSAYVGKIVHALRALEQLLRTVCADKVLPEHSRNGSRENRFSIASASHEVTDIFNLELVPVDKESPGEHLESDTHPVIRNGGLHESVPQWQAESLPV